jgi:type IV secretory pathway VirB2 component (pilin)
MRRINSVVFLLAAMSSSAYGATATGLPWDTVANIIVRSVTGPVAFLICVMAIGVGFGNVIISHHGEFTGWGKTVVLVGLGGSAVMGIVSLMAGMFGVTGAVV